jgi:hypothetical protein
MNSTSLSADSQFITKLVEKQTFLFFYVKKLKVRATYSNKVLGQIAAFEKFASAQFHLSFR